ncbi:MAG: hypothetical protein AAF599_08420, partial [Bacteroidota bacterium]
VHNSADFNSGTPTEIALADDGNGNMVATVDLSDGDFFTFGAEIGAPGCVAADLTLWTKADAGTSATSNGDAISQWNDLTVNGFDLTQATATQQPTYVEGTASTNYNPALDFNDDFLNNTNRIVQTTDGLTMISVASTDVLNGLRTVIGMGDNYNDPVVDLQSTLISPFMDGSGDVDLFNGQLTAGEPMIWSTRAPNEGTNTSANSLRFAYQGEEVSTLLEIVSSNVFYGQNVGVGSDGGGEDWDGQIMETIIYNRELTIAEWQKVHSYLAIKYGITLRAVDSDATIVEGDYISGGDTKIWDYTANAAYHNNVIGIGREDCQELEQQISRSVFSGDIVTLASSNDFVSANNRGGRTSISADASFLMLGSDNGVTTRQSTELDASTAFNTRIAREWRVQATNFNQAVSLKFDGFGSDLDFEWHLVYDTDNDFSSGVTDLGALDEDGIIENVTLSTGYITLKAIATDSDGDMVINFDDLDDDNDGITDVDEVVITPVSVPINSFDIEKYEIANAFDFERMPLPTSDRVLTADFTDFNSDGDIEQGWTATLFQSALGVSNVVFENGYASEPNNNATDFRYLIDSVNGILQQYTLTFEGNIDGGMAAFLNNEVILENCCGDDDVSGNNAPQSVTFTASPGNVITVRSFNLTPAGQSINFDLVQTGTSSGTDIDGDGIANVLDLDSDNDGCADYLEGGAGFSTSDGTTAMGTLSDGNGDTVTENLGNTIDANGIPTIAMGGQSLAFSQSSVYNACIDSDNDGLGDLADKDDDNDGITDAEETTFSSINVPISTFSIEKYEITSSSDFEVYPQPASNLVLTADFTDFNNDGDIEQGWTSTNFQAASGVSNVIFQNGYSTEPNSNVTDFEYVADVADGLYQRYTIIFEGNVDGGMARSGTSAIVVSVRRRAIPSIKS